MGSGPEPLSLAPGEPPRHIDVDTQFKDAIASHRERGPDQGNVPVTSLVAGDIAFWNKEPYLVLERDDADQTIRVINADGETSAVPFPINPDANIPVVLSPNQDMRTQNAMQPVLDAWFREREPDTLPTTPQFEQGMGIVQVAGPDTATGGLAVNRLPGDIVFEQGEPLLVLNNDREGRMVTVDMTGTVTPVVYQTDEQMPGPKPQDVVNPEVELAVQDMLAAYREQREPQRAPAESPIGVPVGPDLPQHLDVTPFFERDMNNVALSGATQQNVAAKRIIPGDVVFDGPETPPRLVLENHTDTGELIMVSGDGTVLRQPYTDQGVFNAMPATDQGNYGNHLPGFDDAMFDYFGQKRPAQQPSAMDTDALRENFANTMMLLFDEEPNATDIPPENLIPGDVVFDDEGSPQLVVLNDVADKRIEVVDNIGLVRFRDYGTGDIAGIPPANQPGGDIAPGLREVMRRYNERPRNEGDDAILFLGDVPSGPDIPQKGRFVDRMGVDDGFQGIMDRLEHEQPKADMPPAEMVAGDVIYPFGDADLPEMIVDTEIPGPGGGAKLTTLNRNGDINDRVFDPERPMQATRIGQLDGAAEITLRQTLDDYRNGPPSDGLPPGIRVTVPSIAAIERPKGYAGAMVDYKLDGPETKLGDLRASALRPGDVIWLPETNAAGQHEPAVVLENSNAGGASYMRLVDQDGLITDRHYDVADDTLYAYRPDQANVREIVTRYNANIAGDVRVGGAPGVRHIEPPEPFQDEMDRLFDEGPQHEGFIAPNTFIPGDVVFNDDGDPALVVDNNHDLHQLTVVDAFGLVEQRDYSLNEPIRATLIDEQHTGGEPNLALQPMINAFNRGDVAEPAGATQYGGKAGLLTNVSTDDVPDLPTYGEEITNHLQPGKINKFVAFENHDTGDRGIFFWDTGDDAISSTIHHSHVAEALENDGYLDENFDWYAGEANDTDDLHEPFHDVGPGEASASNMENYGDAFPEWLEDRISQEMGVPLGQWAQRQLGADLARRAGVDVVDPNPDIERIHGTPVPANAQPVSGDFENRVHPLDNAIVIADDPQTVQETLSAIGTVHDLRRDDPLLQISNEDFGNANALEAQYLPPGFSRLGLGSYNPDGRNPRVLMGRGTSEPRLTMVHEFGHYLDNMELADRRQLGSGPRGTPSAARGDGPRAEMVAPVMDAIGASRKYGELRERSDGDTLGRILGGSWYDYALRPEELFARAYTQYIKQKADDPALNNEWERWQQQDTDLGIEDFSMQNWEPEDFAPISDALDRMFAESMARQDEAANIGRTEEEIAAQRRRNA